MTDKRLTPRISYDMGVGQPTEIEWRICRTDTAEKLLEWPISTCKGCAYCTFNIPASRQGHAHDVQRGLTSQPRERPPSWRQTTVSADIGEDGRACSPHAQWAKESVQPLRRAVRQHLDIKQSDPVTLQFPSSVYNRDT